MSRTPEQVSQDIRRRLRETDSSLTAEVGTPERKIIDAVSEVVSAAYMDSYLLSTTWDLDNKVGVELDQLVGLFGFGRMDGRRATGAVTFTLSQPATAEMLIPSGSIVFVPETDVTPQINYSTLANVYIPEGQSEVVVDVECIHSSSVGNTVANTVTGTQALAALGTVTNKVAITGGLDPEEDNELKERFKSTFLRNLAGTGDYYAALCLQVPEVSKVRVVGPTEKYEEQVQFNEGEFTTHTGNTTSKFNWPRNTFLAHMPRTEEEVYFSHGVHYVTDPNVYPMSITALDTTLTELVTELEYEYTPLISRNDPVNGVTNKVDVFINGISGREVTEVRRYDPIHLTSSNEDPEKVHSNYMRTNGNNPGTGYLLPLTYQPVLQAPQSITFQGEVKELGKDYYLIISRSNQRGSTREYGGLWSSSPLFTAGVEIMFNYTYNELPEVLGTIIEANKQVGTDVLVREANYRYFEFNLIVAFDSQATKTDIETGARNVLTKWFNTQGFGSWVQKSDVEALVHTIGGVDAVRVARANDTEVSAGFIEYSRQGDVMGLHNSDLRLKENELPVLQGVNIIRRSQMNFGG